MNTKSIDKKANYSYGNYDNEKPVNYSLKIANCRGKKPVLKDIEKARAIINGLLIELNPCDGKDALKQCDTLLWSIICDNNK